MSKDSASGRQYVSLSFAHRCDPATEAATAEFWETVGRVLTDLERECLQRCVLSNQSQEIAAREMGVCQQNVSAAVCRAKRVIASDPSLVESLRAIVADQHRVKVDRRLHPKNPPTGDRFQEAKSQEIAA